MQLDEYATRLAEAGGFDAADLAANREGRLTESQRARLRSFRAGWAVFVAITGLLTLGLLLAAYRLRSLAGLALAAICAMAAFAFAVRLRGSWAPAGVTTYEGPIKKEDPDAIRAGRLRLFVGDELFDALEASRPHRVHYVSEAGRVVSIEPLRPS